MHTLPAENAVGLDTADINFYSLALSISLPLSLSLSFCLSLSLSLSVALSLSRARARARTHTHTHTERETQRRAVPTHTCVREATAQARVRIPGTGCQIASVGPQGRLCRYQLHHGTLSVWEHSTGHTPRPAHPLAPPALDSDLDLCLCT
jgi:hypothetical protein